LEVTSSQPHQKAKGQLHLAYAICGVSSEAYIYIPLLNKVCVRKAASCHELRATKIANRKVSCNMPPFAQKPRSKTKEITLTERIDREDILMYQLYVGVLSSFLSTASYLCAPAFTKTAFLIRAPFSPEP
jgi:hypothetical protein